VEEGGTLYAFECKAKELPMEKDVRGLDLLERTFKGGSLKRVILCRTPGFIERFADLEVTLDNGCNLDKIFQPAV